LLLFFFHFSSLKGLQTQSHGPLTPRGLQNWDACQKRPRRVGLHLAHGSANPRHADLQTRSPESAALPCPTKQFVILRFRVCSLAMPYQTVQSKVKSLTVYSNSLYSTKQYNPQWKTLIFYSNSLYSKTLIPFSYS